MSFDTFTISAIAVILAVLLGFVYVLHQSNTELKGNLRALESRMTDGGGSPTPQRPASRELCGAIHKIYPQSQVGVDFVLGYKDGRPVIEEWLSPVPKPTEKQIGEAVKAYREEQESESYRELRQAKYPAIGDQLDAMHKARLGDATDLRAIDELIARVKSEHPKPGQC